MVVKVAVIGGGVIGVTSAVVVLENLADVEVTLISNKWSPDTTGDGSAGYWCPYLLGDVPTNLLREWCRKSFEIFEVIYKSPVAVDYGVGLLSVYTLSKNPVEKPDYSDLFLEWRLMTSKEHSAFLGDYPYGSFSTTFFVECVKFLPALMKRFEKGGGKIIHKKVENIPEFAGKYDFVVNCTGLGARNLVPDPEVIPVRGQVMRVRAPWIKHGVVIDNEFYILPNTDEVICGGTHQENDWRLEVDPEDHRNIWEGCTDVVPCLKDGEILRDWVGLRPFRSPPRLERETLHTKNGKLEVVHNYGHGGSGVTLCFGCAYHALRLLKEALRVPSHL